MAKITNISAYKFTPLDGLKALRDDLRGCCRAEGLKGTILLSTEGINLFVAGPRSGIDAFVGRLRGLPGLDDLAPKYSESAHQPFNRMLVRIKKEIIAFGIEGIDPARKPARRIAPRELKQWLDEGRPVTLLDTRNDYEVRLGTFKGAVPAGIRHFRDFPRAAQTLAGLRGRTVVTFCTGGIRCEKAAPLLEREGFTDVLQLDGGILKYFEECGGAHYEGECFVFDQRVGVDPSLRETESAVCYGCLAPLTAEEQADPRYRPPHTCPHCHKDADELHAARVARLQAAVDKVVQPLPGASPYENARPVNVPERFDNATVLTFLAGLLPHVPEAHWAAECAAGHIRDESGTPLAADSVVRAGQRCLHIRPEETEPDVDARIRILHEDEALLVLAKPAPLPMHPAGRYNRNTLVHILALACAPFKPRPAHRLDANTTGVVVCARTRHFARFLQPLFARGEVEKTYLVRVLGQPESDTFSCDAPVSAGPTATGCRTVDETAGLSARTDFRVIARSPADNTTLLEARPRTGRTNQIRVHLWHLGLPVLGDPAYLPGRRIGTTQTLPVHAPPLCLHAWKIAFAHPLTGERLQFEAPPPAWANP
ncbi:MAG: RluA family pseudouridine synthase [Opitutales bacterium]|nr:RluA family pseudouridine synthase [Opitutales bacterium]